MKKSIVGVSLLTVFLCSGCILSKIDQSIVYLKDDTFCCKEIGEGEAAVGDIKDEATEKLELSSEDMLDFAVKFTELVDLIKGDNRFDI
jgi:hypothetical protein